MTLPYSTPAELVAAFKAGQKFALHYHGKTFGVTHMKAREKVVYVQPPGFPVKVWPDGRSAEGTSDAIRLEFDDGTATRKTLDSLGVGGRDASR